MRQPAVAGTFYPSSPGKLTSLVRQYLAEAAPATSTRLPKALIAPHAGYVYSGPIAGSAFKQLEGKMGGVRKVVIIGPAHTVAIRGLATVTADEFDTPLKAVPVDKASVAAICKLPQVEMNDAAHRQEHALEVMLPFLQTLTADFAIVPIVAGLTTGAEAADVLGKLWGGPETVIIISSDLSHYLDYESARRLDQQTAAAIAQLQPEKLSRESACGRIPIQGLLLKAREENLRVATLDLRNSGDTAGSKDRVVGYGAFAFYEA